MKLPDVAVALFVEVVENALVMLKIELKAMYSKAEERNTILVRGSGSAHTLSQEISAEG